MTIPANGAVNELKRFLFCRLRRPRDIDPLASEVLHQLQQDATRTERNTDLLGLLWRVATDRLTALRKTRAYGFECECECECGEHHDARLPDLFDQVVSQLPSIHAAILIAHKRDRIPHHQLAKKFRLGVSTVEKYLSQARALIRAFAVSPISAEDARLIVVARDELLVAQQAAEWLYQPTALGTARRQEFLQWLLQCRLHVRELLLAASWDALFDLICSVPSRSRSTNRER